MIRKGWFSCDKLKDLRFCGIHCNDGDDDDDDDDEAAGHLLRVVP